MNRLSCRELQRDEEIQAAFGLMSQLRPRLRADTFLAEVRRQQRDGYRLVGAWSGDRQVALAGVRRSHTLSRGEHLFVDDLVTASDLRGRGYGTALLRALASEAASEGIPMLYLDARETARGFYEKLGFTFATSIPCGIETSRLAAPGTRR